MDTKVGEVIIDSQKALDSFIKELAYKLSDGVYDNLIGFLWHFENKTLIEPTPEIIEREHKKYEGNEFFKVLAMAFAVNMAHEFYHWMEERVEGENQIKH